MYRDVIIIRGTTLFQQINCPLASINAFVCNVTTRLFLFISIQNSGSAESYAPNNLY